MKYSIRLIAILFLLMLVYGCTKASAQAGRGGLNGLVSDGTGAVIPNAKVVLLNNGTGVEQTTYSTSAGLYTFVSLNPGVYQVTVSVNGFETTTRKNIPVNVDQETAANISLKVGSVADVVTVTATGDLVDTNNSTVGQLISAQTMDRVPLFSRDVFQLVQLSAGVSPANGSANSSDTPGVFNSRPGIDVSSYTINGALQGAVYFMVDGSPLGVAENNAAAIIPAFQIPEEAIAEYRVETQNAPATYSSGGAGVISLVTKSGGNQFHGSAFGYFRPDALAANDYFNKLNNPGSGTPAFHRYQEGGSISGPILHKKLFFFGDFEATQQASFDGETLTVPTAAEQQGDFTADSFPIYNPLVDDVTSSLDGVSMVRQQFAGTNSGPGCASATANCIPTADFNPTAQLIAQHFPAPNLPGTGPYHIGNYFYPGLDPYRAKKFDVRLDYQQGERQNLFARYSYEDLFFSNAQIFGPSNMWDANYYQNVTHAFNTVVADDVTLSPTSVLAIRYNFTRHFENQTGDPRQTGFDLTTLGFPASLAAAENYKTLPIIYFGNGTQTIGGTDNWDTFIFASEASDALVTFTKTFGRHEMNIGAEYEKLFMNIGQPPAPSGGYNFDSSATTLTTNSTALGNLSNIDPNLVAGGSDFGSFLIGMGSTPGNESYNFTKDLFAAEASPYYAAYFQDKFHLTKKLTLDYGVRWDIFGGRTERHNRQEYFDPTLAATSNGVNFIGAEQFTTSGNRSPYKLNLSDVAPRMGVAWQPVQHLVLRGAFGIYYGPSSHMVANPSLNDDGFGTVSAWNATQYNANSNSIFNSSSACINNNNPAGCYSLSNPFPDGVTLPLGASLGAANNLGNTLNAVLHSQRTMTTYNFNFGVEYELPHQIILSAAYVGSRGLFLPFSNYDLNELSLQTIASNGDQLCLPSSSGCTMVNNQWAAIQPSSNANYGASTVPLWVSLQKYPQFGTGNYGAGNGINIHGFAGGDSEYSSLQAKIEKRLSDHWTTLATFTWGKIMTDDSGTPLGFVGYHSGSPQDSQNLNLEHSVSPQDVKLQFNWQLSYDLPIGKGRLIALNGKADTLLGGWTVNTIVYLSTGVPIAAPTGTGDSFFNQRVDLTCDPGKGAAHTVNQWFDWACFSQPYSPLIAGTAPAYLSGIRTDGAHDLDVSLYKNFKLPREMNLRFEVAAYNATNTVQFGYPNVFWNQTPNSSTMAGFGQVFGDVNTPRQFQFGTRFMF